MAVRIGLDVIGSASTKMLVPWEWCRMQCKICYACTSFLATHPAAEPHARARKSDSLLVSTVQTPRRNAQEKLTMCDVVFMADTGDSCDQRSREEPREWWVWCVHIRTPHRITVRQPNGKGGPLPSACLAPPSCARSLALPPQRRRRLQN